MRPAVRCGNAGWRTTGLVEITLDNETATNPNFRADAQKAGSGYGLLEWPALLRSLDRVDPSYRD